MDNGCLTYNHYIDHLTSQCEISNRPPHIILDIYEGSLVVVEQKIKRGVENPCVVTVTHYYAYTKKSSTRRQIKYDVGLSIVVDITVVNNDLALLQMFQQVSHNGNLVASNSKSMFEILVETSEAIPKKGVQKDLH